jgi:microcystin-dependent protein
MPGADGVNAPVPLKWTAEGVTSGDPSGAGKLVINADSTTLRLNYTDANGTNASGFIPAFTAGFIVLADSAGHTDIFSINGFTDSFPNAFFDVSLASGVVLTIDYTSATCAVQFLAIPAPISAAVLPTGMITPFAIAAAPAGWALCNGELMDRTAFAALFAVIGETYGAGDGSSTFALPDLRGRVVAGMDNMGGGAAGRLTDATLALGLGTETVTLDVTQIPAHHHVGGLHNHTLNATINTVGDPGGTTAVTDFSGSMNNTGVAGDVDTSDTGGDQAHSNVQPTMVLNYIIKT